MTASADRVRRAIRAQRARQNTATRLDDVVRLAGLYKDIYTSEASDETVEETREQLFDAVDAFRESCR